MSGAPIGLIAGQGRLPVLVAENMRRAGRSVVCVGLRHNYDAAALTPLCDRIAPAGITRPSRWIRLLRGAGVSEAVMVGRVAKARMHDPLRIVRNLPDLRAIRLWYRVLRHDRRSAAVLAAVADELASEGVTLIDSTTYIPEHMAVVGPMGRVQPTPDQEADVTFGWPLLQQLLGLDIGQSAAVRDRDVIAVEAVEGTDEMIRRAGELCRTKGWTLLKSASDTHDNRADVPTIGVHTIEHAAACGARCIAVGAGRVILVDKPEVIAAADAKGIALVGVD